VGTPSSVEGIDVRALSVELVGVGDGEASAEGLDSADGVVSPEGEAVIAGIELSPAAKITNVLETFCSFP